LVDGVVDATDLNWLDFEFGGFKYMVAEMPTFPLWQNSPAFLTFFHHPYSDL